MPLHAQDERMLVVTLAHIPGRRIIVLGHVYGSAIRPYDTLPGTDAPGALGVLEDDRGDASDRMVDMAIEREADAVVGWRCSSVAMQRYTELFSYGTAVRFRSTRR